MLEELEIHNLGPIRSALIAPAGGMTAITGETGAGKSMLLSAIRLISGGPSDGGRVSVGAQEAWAQGVFEVASSPAAVAAAREAGFEPEDGELFLSRKVPASGRSRSMLSGRSVPRSVLASVAAELVTIHGQADQLRIATVSRQREFLDRYAGDEVALAAHEDQGVASGFVYKTAPHVTIGSIVNDDHPAEETLYDQPEIDKTKVRITGPFTVEALPAPVVKPLDDIGDIEEDFSAKQTDWRDQLLATGILGRGGSRLTFSRVEPLSGTKFLQAEAETKEDTPRRAVICFADETKPLDSRMVAMAMDEVERLRPAPKLVIFAAFQFDPEAAKDIDEYIYPGVTVLKAQMNTDLMTEDLKKKRSSDQSFWLVGQPDVELIRDGRSKRKFKVKVNGFDYYDVKKGTVESGSTSRIAMWMLDTDYDGMCIEPKQVFFPMGGKKDGWNKLAKTLKTEVDPDLIEKYAGNESLWFMAEPNTRIAVKIIDDRGIESLKVIRIGDE